MGNQSGRSTDKEEGRKRREWKRRLIKTGRKGEMDRSRAEGLKKKKKEGEEIGEQVNSDHRK